MRLMCIFVHMIDNIKAHLKDVAAFSASTLDEVEQFRIAYLGKKGHITKLFADFRNVPNEEKKEYGQLLNQLKTAALAKVKALQTELGGMQSSKSAMDDISRPGQPIPLGARHPISIVRDNVIDVLDLIQIVLIWDGKNFLKVMSWDQIMDLLLVLRKWLRMEKSPLLNL